MPAERAASMAAESTWETTPRVLADVDRCQAEAASMAPGRLRSTIKRAAGCWGRSVGFLTTVKGMFADFAAVVMREERSKSFTRMRMEVPIILSFY